MNKLWLLVCMVWSALGAVALFFIDRSVVGGFVWLAGGFMIGCMGRLFGERLMESIPHSATGPPPDIAFVSPFVGLTYGLLLGSVVGIAAGLEGEGPGWLTVLIGVTVGPPTVSFLALVLYTLLSAVTGDRLAMRPRHRAVLALMCLALPLVALAVLVRCLLWIPRHRRRLEVFRWAEDLGGVFGADPEGDRFFGVNFEGTVVSDEDVARLRVFWELETLRLSGRGITDRALSHLRHLKRLKILGLLFTSVTDSGLAHLAGLTTLEVLDLAGTSIGDQGLSNLRRMHRLGWLDVRGTLVTESGIRELSRTLPNLQVQR
jgi:hypothetical protein